MFVAMFLPYRHHRLAAIKLDKDPVVGGVYENASLEELEAEMKKHWLRLAPVLDLEALIAPADGTANREVPQGERAVLGSHMTKAPQH
jgi:hypothetical protein